MDVCCDKEVRGDAFRNLFGANHSEIQYSPERGYGLGYSNTGLIGHNKQGLSIKYRIDGRHAYVELRKVTCSQD